MFQLFVLKFQCLLSTYQKKAVLWHCYIQRADTNILKHFSLFFEFRTRKVSFQQNCLFLIFHFLKDTQLALRSEEISQLISSQTVCLIFHSYYSSIRPQLSSFIFVFKVASHFSTQCRSEASRSSNGCTYCYVSIAFPREIRCRG